MPWSAHLADNARSNRSVDAVTIPLKLSWSMDLKAHSMFAPFPLKEPSAPLIAGGKLFVTTASGAIHSLDYETGLLNWTVKSDYPIDSPPAEGFGKICSGSTDGELICRDEETGRQLWRYSARSMINVSPLILNDRVIAASSDDRVHAVDMATGKKLWTYTRGTFQTVANMPASSPAVAGDRIIQLFTDGMLGAIDAVTGRELWLTKVYTNFKSSERRRTTPLVAGKDIYILDAQGALLAIDSATGAIKSTNNVIKARDFVLVSPVDAVLLGADTVLSFNIPTGAINWKYDVDGQSAVSLMSAGDYVFVISDYTHYTWGFESLSKVWSRIEALNARTGAKEWRSELKDHLSAVSSAAGSLYTLTDRGFLRVYGISGCHICSKNMVYKDTRY